ncbi:hypothetical protein AB0L00_15380 [Actinoallomurus sp. NPDC052308]|uniref:hypothetical protein n=1 Tax=Actinoallomurus sp. NPDC052308 TaxID=3155530 RepID=UPI00343353B8
MPEDARLQGPRMVNAVGRAGRAGKETEGWIVLVRAAAPSAADFADLAPTAEELTFSSSIAATSALRAIADLEHIAREADDAVLRRAGGAAADFVAFLWFYLADEEARGIDPDQVDLDVFIDELLAAAQAPEHVPTFSAVAHTVQRQYMRTDPTARRRWPRTGTSIGSAQVIDARARQLAKLISQQDPPEADILNRAGPTLELLARTGAISALLALPENTAAWDFRTTPKGASFDVSISAVLADWLNGRSYAQLAETHLAQMTDAARRIEAMVDAVTHRFEHFLAWTVGALVELVNLYLADAESDHRLCPELGPYIRYGVSDARALSLMMQGLRSRRLAHEIARQIPEDDQPGGTDPASG